MNEKMKATFAVAIVAMMVFAAAGATTYSWFSDTEETDITVSTAKVNILGKFTTVSYGNYVDTSAGIDDDGNLSINNVVADRTVNATYTVTNCSTIDTQYRAYIVVSGLDATQIKKIGVSVEGESVTFESGIGYFVGKATEGVKLDKAINPKGDSKDYKFVITTSSDIDNSFPKFSMKVVIEAYQAGYNYSAPVFMDNGDVSFGDVVGKNVKVEGTSASDDDAASVPFTMEFDQDASAKISNSTLSVKAVESPSGYFKIGSEANAVVLDIKINGNDVPDLGGYVTITVPIEGEIVEPDVYYTSVDNYPVDIEVIGTSYDGKYTYVTFKTNHFSEYVVGDFVAKVDNTYYSDLKNAIDSANDDTVYVLKDYTGSGVVIDKDVTIDFRGYTYVFNKGVGSTGTVTNGFQILKDNDVTLKNGVLTVDADHASDFYILLQNYANLKVDGMILDGTNLDKYSLTDGDSYVSSNNCGKVSISNTTIIANDDGDLAFAFDVCDQRSKGYSLPTVTVTDCVINGNIDAAARVGNTYYATLQQAIDNAVNENEIDFCKDVAGDVTVEQKSGVKIAIDGNKFEFAGVLTVDGKSARYETAGLTIKNVNFTAVSSTADACISLGVKGNNDTRYTNNVTVEGCTFTDTSSSFKVAAVRSHTGGDRNLIISNCTVNESMHSLLQVSNVEQGLVISDCMVYSKNGINLNSTPSVTIEGCTIDVKGYTVRFGVNQPGAINGEFSIINSVLKSKNDDGDGVFIFRQNATGSTLSLTNTTYEGSPLIKNEGSTGVKVSIDGNDYAYDSNSLATLVGADNSTIYLLAGTYGIPNNVAGKTLKFIGEGKDTVFDFTKAYNVGGASITFNNIFFQGKNENVLNGFGIWHTGGTITYVGCTFDGAVTSEFSGDVVYDKCTFTGTGYITTYSVDSAKFTSCVFDKADSRAVLVYSHGDNPCVVTLNGCTFKADAIGKTGAGEWTAAVEIDTTNIPTSGTSVTISGCTYDDKYSGLYRDKSAEGKANAVIIEN